MISCDKCKQPITQSFNKVTFQMVRIIGMKTLNKICSDTQKVIIPPMPRQHEVTLDLCPDCQEKIIKDILGVVPWKEGE